MKPTAKYINRRQSVRGLFRVQWRHQKTCSAQRKKKKKKKKNSLLCPTLPHLSGRDRRPCSLHKRRRSRTITSVLVVGIHVEFMSGFMFQWCTIGRPLQRNRVANSRLQLHPIQQSQFQFIITLTINLIININNNSYHIVDW